MLRHERLAVCGGLALLVLISWWYLTIGANGRMDAMSTPPFGITVLMWWLMMMAMMLPSASPAVLLYGKVRAIRSGDSDIANTWIFLSGYLAIWLIFSIAAALAQLLLTGPSMALGSRYQQGALLIAAGAYQLSPLKSACMRECRAPAQFISRHWQAGRSGAVQLGVRHGVYCLGCCWMLMALLFVGGIMNLMWVVGLTLIVAIEKLAPLGARIGKIAGVGLVVWGLAKFGGF